MRRYTNILFLISVLIYQFNLIQSATENVICLYQFVASTRPNKGNYLPKNIDPKLCTHINYFYVNLEIDGSLVIINKDTFQDHINQLQNLKSINPNVKLLLTVGGPLTMDDTFPIIAQDDELINNLIKTLTTFLKDNRFDGIEINWVYPTKDQSDIFLNFMTKIKDAFSVDKYILQVCVYPYPTSLGYKAKELSKVVDGINILTYDLLSPYMTFTSGNANLYSPSTSNKYLQQFNVDRSILSWLTIGVDTEKVNLAIPFYGNTYKLVVPANHQIGSNSSGPGVREQYTQSIGFAGFNEICEFHSDATHDWDDSVKTAFLYKDRLWIGYDDTKSVEIKVKYAIEQKLGGIVAWSIDTDDLTGACGEPNGLLKTINKVLKRIK